MRMSFPRLARGFVIPAPAPSPPPPGACCGAPADAGLPGDPRQRREMRRRRGSRQPPVGLGGPKGPLAKARSHRAVPPPRLELPEARRRRGGGGAAQARGLWRNCRHHRLSPTPNTPALSGRRHPAH